MHMECMLMEARALMAPVSTHDFADDSPFLVPRNKYFLGSWL